MVGQWWGFCICGQKKRSSGSGLKGQTRARGRPSQTQPNAAVQGKVLVCCASHRALPTPATGELAWAEAAGMPHRTKDLEQVLCFLKKKHEARSQGRDGHIPVLGQPVLFSRE